MRVRSASCSPSVTTPPPSYATTATTADRPSSFANGRYQVRELLGEGGKKKVYLALIKTEGLDDTSRSRISREAQAMGRLGSHPHIVTVFDLGQEAD